MTHKYQRLCVDLMPSLKSLLTHPLDRQVSRKLYRFATILGILLFISGCTITSPKTSPDISNAADTLKPPPISWQISGKLGIRSPQKNGSVSINWQQLGDNFTIKVQGPLGQGSAIITGTQYNAEIKQPGKAPVRSSNVDELVYNSFGWSLPFNDFVHWIRATANPAQPISHISYEPELNTLSLLEQSHWSLEYSRYKPVESWLLPGRIKATQNGTRLTLLIRKWTIL